VHPEKLGLLGMAIGQSKIDEIGFSESESKSSRPSMSSQTLIIESRDNKCFGFSGTRVILVVLRCSRKS
jgi:hypothetical protein